MPGLNLTPAAGTPGPPGNPGPPGDPGPPGNPGDPGADAPVPTRASLQHTTSVLAANAEESALIELGAGYQLVRVTTNIPARVRLYTSTAQRAADASRLTTADPAGNHGLMAEVITTADDLEFDLSPTVYGFTSDATSSVPALIANLDAASAAVTVTFTYLQMEQ